MKKFALIGKDISYSLSPLIHNELLKIYNIKGNYNLVELTAINNISKNKLLLNSGLNITIPYKEQIVKYVDQLEGDAKELKLINTISHTNDNKILGYNTDILGFDRFFKNNIKEVQKVGILANSATAKMLKYYFKKYLNIEAIIFSSKEIEQTISYEKIINYNIDFLINTSPLGQGQYVNQSILKKETLRDLKLKYVLEFNYNPYNTRLLKDSKELGYRTFNGLDVLVGQGIYSFEIWNQIKTDNSTFNRIKSLLENKLVNNFLVYGMPLSGKSTMYKQLLNTNLKNQKITLIDLDEYVENEFIIKTTNFKTIKSYVVSHGIEEFRNLEFIALQHLLLKGSKKIIFAGGGTLTNHNIYKLLDNTILYYLEVDYQDLILRALANDISNRPLFKGTCKEEMISQYKSLYEKRIDFYNSIYDYKIKTINDLKKYITFLGE